MRDEARWRELWDECVRLYDRELSEAVTRNMWTRIMDEKAPVHGIVAEHHDEGVIRTANDVIHESTTWRIPITIANSSLHISTDLARSPTE